MTKQAYSFPLTQSLSYEAASNVLGDGSVKGGGQMGSSGDGAPARRGLEI